MVRYPAVYRAFYGIQRPVAVFVFVQEGKVFVILALRIEIRLQPFLQLQQAGVEGQSCGNQAVVALRALPLTPCALEGV